MKAYISGSEEPYRAEIVLDSEKLSEAKEVIGGRPTTEIMGHFAVLLYEEELEEIISMPLVMIIDQRTLV